MDQHYSQNQAGIVSSPLPGKVVKILAQEGDQVEAGQKLFLIESMKMFHELQVSQEGTVSDINVKVGDIIAPTTHLASVS
ncbi:biotin/lipoyl-binding protein [candidate division KSB3 bacterium]|uniref:Biotin/lipoyl-binding protein n=1 Tax=candidate division KSB3 bacterium TaxID=2044937 RepID=A0A9D5Q945_9BACT|nr:biotin/lipoyl-binding protein [candidate division KSB3 bacterium]MBD3327511.1 biotin/lipoyl-binding protein [candidate division KSB3 bacterium]